MMQDEPSPFRRATGQVRIGDAERDQAVAALSEHFVAGRITQTEFEERSDQATRARYVDDLAPLFADLPDDRAVEQFPYAVVVRPDRAPWARGSSRPQRFSPPPLFWLLPLMMTGLVVASVAFAAPWVLWILFWVFIIGGPRARYRRQHQSSGDGRFQRGFGR
ncbi:DUF1707 SHOCT-like domain-containing protein [Kribbella monticola]|uniref:DUF1707 SHOCT-like domain-containing protein n=1 Tax=Kribbella monticola TaxID=2185285 RepID=UPI001E4AC633|nr:DUF1707 domain-containing protein [Kribbella monticola]